MRLFIKLENGSELETVLLAAGRDRMRVVIPGQRDTVDLTRLEGNWRIEPGQALEISALIPLAGADYSQFCAELYPKTMSAGRSFTI